MNGEPVLVVRHWEKKYLMVKNWRRVGLIFGEVFLSYNTPPPPNKKGYVLAFDIGLFDANKFSARKFSFFLPIVRVFPYFFKIRFKTLNFVIFRVLAASCRVVAKTTMISKKIVVP